MTNEKMGQFISELRKSKQMTQKDLASKLSITDKAVSKWERGLSCPDISLLSTLAEVLDVTTSELLNGEKNDCSKNEVETCIDNALLYADKSVKSKAKSMQSICATSFTALLLIGMIVCAICDLAISGTFTWSWYPISSSIFAWLILFPIIKFGTKGIFGSLISCSVFIIPFMYILNFLVKDYDLLLPISIRISIISIIYLWIIYALFRILKKRKLLATGISILLCIPVTFGINFILYRLISDQLLDMWDLIGFCITLAIASVFIIVDCSARKNSKNLTRSH